MNREPIAVPSAASSPPRLAALRGRWLWIARITWVVAALLCVGLFAAGLAITFARLETACPNAPCDDRRLTGEQIQQLGTQGLSVGFYAAATVVPRLVAMLVWSGVGLLIFVRRSDDRMAWFVALFLVASGATVNAETLNTLAAAYPALKPIIDLLQLVALVCLFLFFGLFPNGEFVPRWMRWAVWFYPIVLTLSSVFPGSFVDPTAWPLLLNWVVLALSYGTLVFAQVYRYRRSSNPHERRQTRWVMLGASAALVGLICLILIGEVLVPSLNRPGTLSTLALEYGATVCLLLIPLSIGVAVLRERLWGIDLIINRALVYGSLTAAVAALYIVIVGSLSALFQAQGNLAIALIATGVVAMLFQPLRDRFQHGVNRLVYGERDDPYAVLTRLDQRLATAIAPEAVLPTIVETVAQALRLPYVAVALDWDAGCATAASVGSPVAGMIHLPLVYQGETIGRLILGQRAPGESFSAADQRLLASLAQHTGAAAHAMRLTTDLQRSRELLVRTREEERRRLRRDLHDGLGPTLASQALTIDTACLLLERDPQGAAALLREVKAQSKVAIGEIRRVVHALRPPALDDLGLVGALREQVTLYRSAGLEVLVEVPEQLPALPAAVEVAVYRIALEALTNVLKHARAQRCTITLAVETALELTIADDGAGIPADRRAGVGLSSMRERAEELGGTYNIGPNPGGGTQVKAVLPLG